jgi:hypothetical protein
MRLSIFAFAGLVLFTVVSLGSGSAPDKAPMPPDKPEGIEVKATPIPERDEELRRLLKGRYEAAAGEMAARTALFNGGRESLSDTCDAIRRFSTAGMEMAETQADRLKICEQALESAKAIEDAVKRKFESDLEPVQAMKLATYTRLDMEIKLHLARKAAGAEKLENRPANKDLPPIPPAAKLET